MYVCLKCTQFLKINAGNSLSVYNVYYPDDPNHHPQATGVECNKRGAWVNSLSYEDDMVLLSPTVTALVADMLAVPHDTIHNTKKTVCILVRPKRSQGRYST